LRASQPLHPYTKFPQQQWQEDFSLFFFLDRFVYAPSQHEHTHTGQNHRNHLYPIDNPILHTGLDEHEENGKTASKDILLWEARRFDRERE